MLKDHSMDDQSLSPAVRSLLASKPGQRLGRAKLPAAGFTLVELIVVSAIIGILATLAIPAYRVFIELAKNSRAKTEIRLLETEISDFQAQYGVLPGSLADIDRGTLNDPWGNTYVYNDFRDLVTTPARRYSADDLNNDFDLFSMGGGWY